MPLPPPIITTDRRPPRVIVHGAPGIGKTTLAAHAPAPIFLRTDDGQDGMGVAAYDLPSWATLIERLTGLIKEEHAYRTVVIDTLDGVERLIFSHVCQESGVATIEKVDGGYGKGYVAALNQWSRLLAALQILRVERGMTVVLICHSIVKRYASPDLAEFDRYQMRLNDKAQGLLCEWADLVAFLRSETVVRETDSGKAQGVGTGRHLLCCSNDAPAYVGKNRYAVTANVPIPHDRPWSAVEAVLLAKQPSIPQSTPAATAANMKG